MVNHPSNGEKDEKSRDPENIKGTFSDWESLRIQVARLRLEELNTQRFLKSRSVKLSYMQCKQWVQAQNMWETKIEWYKWIDQGENLSAYIPSDPEKYYKRNGSWVSWDDFLGNSKNK